MSPPAAARRAERRAVALLLVAGALMLAVRLGAVLACADPDGDAYGHVNIARALADDPWNLRAHWVWLPGWHYLLAGFFALGGDHASARAVVALVQTVLPFVLYRVLRRAAPHDAEPEALARAQRTACLAALAYTVAPLPNLLGTSAQPEAPFAWALVAAAASLQRGHGVRAGLWLAGASLVRYEAWGAVVALFGYTLLRRLRRRTARARERADGAPAGAGPGVEVDLYASLIPLAVIAVWIILRRVGDGSWFWFVAHTHAFASGIRADNGVPAWMDALVLPLAALGRALGPAALLVPFGLPRAFTGVWVLVAGAFAFLVLGYLGGGVLALPRYLTAFTPFACAAMALAVERLARSLRWRAGRANALAGALLATLAVTTALHFARLSAAHDLPRPPASLTVESN